MEALLEMKKAGAIRSNCFWVGWSPLCVFTALALSLCSCLSPWALMWILSIAIFAWAVLIWNLVEQVT